MCQIEGDLDYDLSQRREFVWAVLACQPSGFFVKVTFSSFLLHNLLEILIACDFFTKDSVEEILLKLQHATHNLR